MIEICMYFIISSRRRHTRSLCDWSSDVCSSDLADAPGLPPVQLDDAADAERLEPRAQAERHEERRMMRPRQPRHGAEIEVVVVVVRDQDRVDRGQVL